jgi:hypothetical protein
MLILAIPIQETQTSVAFDRRYQPVAIILGNQFDDVFVIYDLNSYSINLMFVTVLPMLANETRKRKSEQPI